MSMVELVFGAALGFALAQLALSAISHLMSWGRTTSWGRTMSWGRSEQARKWLRRLIPTQGSAVFAFFVRYAAPIGVSAALLLMGAWAVSDYLKARAAHSSALTSSFDPASATAPAEQQEQQEPPEPRPAAAVPVRSLPPAEADEAATPVDPYADPDFKVRHKRHKTPSLKEALLEKSEARARADLLRETQQHMHRSQYDCEAANRAAKYVTAGLDVWGFAAWQLKYFPTNNYQGATLAQCRDVSHIIDPSWLELQSTVARDNRR
jgi:hypothetical protein